MVRMVYLPVKQVERYFDSNSCGDSWDLFDYLEGKHDLAVCYNAARRLVDWGELALSDEGVESIVSAHRSTMSDDASGAEVLEAAKYDFVFERAKIFE